MESITVPLHPTLEPIEHDNGDDVDLGRAQLAIDTCRTSKSQRGAGNGMFFDLAFSLKTAGMAIPEIESTLHAEAQYARSPQERLAQIPTILNSLRTYSAHWRSVEKTSSIAAEAA
jgi:hypothetical protein